MIRLVLIDDEEPALEECSYVLKENFDVEIVGVFSDPVEALQAIPELEPHGVFLDIEMPELDGFAVAREILNIKKDINIIFVTAFDQYAVEAFEINAVDYVMKPISEERISKALQKIENNMASDINMNRETIRSIIKVEETLNKSSSKLVIWKDDEILLLRSDEVFYFTKEQGNVIAVTTEGRFKTKDTLDNWEDKLASYGFFRSHRSYLVNINKVRKMSPWFNNTYILKLRGVEENVSLSRSRVKEFKRIIGAV